MDLPTLDRLDATKEGASAMTLKLRSVVVAQRRDETADIASFELTADDGEPLPRYEAGAHIDVQAAPGLTRQYSLYALPEPGVGYRIAVLKDPNSRGGSVAMHSLTEGARLQISEPRNHFPLLAGSVRTVLLAGGIGVTPLMAMAEQLHRDGADFQFQYCARSAAHAAFLAKLAAKPYAARIAMHFDDGAPEQRLDVVACLAANPEAHVYVCGPFGFMAWIGEAAERAGLDPSRVHREYFGAEPNSAATEAGTFTVRLARAGRVVKIPADRSILSMLQDEGFDIPKSCEAGVCGTCLTRVVAGSPDHRDYYLNAAERRAGDQMLICCSRSHSAELALDL